MKKYLAVTAALWTTAASGQAAFAGTIEELLKDKGVISAEELQQVNKSKPVDYRLGEGFTFTSSDEKFRLALGSSLQLRYSLIDADDVNNKAAKQAQDASRFELRRVKLFFNGYADNKDLTYRLQLNLANINGGTTSNGGLLEESWVNYRLADGAQLRFGQDKVPFGRQFITSSNAQQFVDQSFVTTALVPGYDTGLQLHGKLGKGLVTYNAGVFGGVGQNTFRATNDNAYSARIVVNPLGEVKYQEGDLESTPKPLLAAGGSYYRNTLKNSATGLEGNQLSFAKSSSVFGLGSALQPADKKFTSSEKIDFDLFGFDTAFKWQGFSAQAEYLYSQAIGSDSGNALRSHGFYVQAGYFVIPKTLEVATRLAWLDPNIHAGDDLWVETQGGLSWYVNGNNLKLQGDYSNIHKQKAIALNNGPSASDDQQVRLQLQLIF